VKKQRSFHIPFFTSHPVLRKVLLGIFVWQIIILINHHRKLNTNFHLSYSDSNYKILGLNLPKDLSFAEEKVPQNNFQIKENLEKEFIENKSWKSTSQLLFNKSQKWFPIIERILKDEKVPDDFKYIAMIESHLSNIVSPMGAAGFWQLMPNTARNYGLIVDENIDERFDVEKSTRAACKHFKDGYKVFKNWTLSAAAYNVGIGSVKKSISTQEKTDYYNLTLNKETASFIYRILAFKTLLSNPEHFGFSHKKTSKFSFPKYNIIKIDSSVYDLNHFAKTLNTNLITLKTFNPWLINDKVINNDRKTIEFKVPKNKNIDISVYFIDLYPPNKSNTNKIDTIITTKEESTENIK
jgi:membrane-bound lytic murein transglycosylase D